MANELENFSGAAFRLLQEEGQLKFRQSLVRARQLAQNLGAPQKLVGRLPFSYLLVLAILQTEEFSSERSEALKTVFAANLYRVPDDEVFKALELFAFKDLEKSLLPFIYESGNRGRVAVYLAARMTVWASPEAFLHFLKAKKWNDTDQINLCYLLRKNEEAKLLALLDSAISGEEKEAVKETIRSFKYLLLHRPSGKPVAPENLDAEPLPADPAKESSSAVPASEPLRNEENIARVLANLDELSQKQILVGKPLLAGISLFFSLILLWFSFQFYIKPETETQAMPRQKKIPSHWVDAVSEKPISAKNIAADKDFRMGELYLTRDRYNEAISLFLDALSQDPDHLMARLRLAYCRLKTGDHDLAAQDFKRILEADSEFLLAHYYLAQIALLQNDHSSAAAHFAAEMKINKDLTIGLEYAGFLQKIGKNSEAENVLEELRRLFPDRTLVVTKPGN